ncbi:HWE histidine kinase domain-containing protein [Sinorhizobium sp. BG8]|uniref:sensor histidine kinase n=1 Tax=Sinorhizobium sp. BG8 TaxID=2613773 RepID=UPI00193DC5BD|nr:HWE histidine kinase domain-containing protein [Sinorhizobium sp. BG8]QRM56475.1 PAS domain-containing protein [Sinorhizobium sp. BG8]
MNDSVQPLQNDIVAALSAPARMAVLSETVPAYYGPDPDFESIAGLAASLLSAPVALVSLLGEVEEWALAQHGFGDIQGSSCESFGAHMLVGETPVCLVVGDAGLDVRFASLPVVRADGGVRFYAGAPVVVRGQAIGAVSVFDYLPREGLSPHTLEQLISLAAVVSNLLLAKEEALARKKAAEVLAREEERHALALDAANVSSWQWDVRTGKVVGNDPFYRMLGLGPAELTNARGLFSTIALSDRKAAIGRLRAALKTGEEYDGLFRTAKSERWLLGRGRVHEWDADGRPRIFLGINIDVTDSHIASARTRLLLRELNHRVKNTLAMLQSLARQTLRQTSDPAEFMEAFSGRLQSISEAHGLLSDHEWGLIHLKMLLEKQISPYAMNYAEQVEIHKDEVELGPDQAVGLGLVLHELSTNARKYGALSTPSGKVVVTARVVDEDGQRVLNMTWHEMGGPPVEPPQRRGFGTILIERSLDKVLGSSVHVEYLPQGVTAVVRLPL